MAFTGGMGSGLHGQFGLFHGQPSHPAAIKKPQDVATAAVVVLSPTTQKCMWQARVEAHQMGSPTVEPGHVLLGCLKHGETDATQPNMLQVRLEHLLQLSRRKLPSNVYLAS
jgi:hypothetical protein